MYSTSRLERFSPNVRGRNLTKSFETGKPISQTSYRLLDSGMCKWTRPFWGTDCRRSPKAFPWPRQPALFCSAGIERTRECLQGEHFVRCCHSTHSPLFRFFSRGCLRRGGGSAAVCDPNLRRNKTDKEKSQKKEFGGRNAPEASQEQIRDVPGTAGTLGPIYVEIHIQGAECPQDRRDI